MHKPIYHFDGVELDTAKREIRFNDHVESLSPLVFGVFELFATRGDEVVTKDELSEALWQGRVVTDASVAQVIRKARTVLENCGADPSIIKTQHGHGYRLDVHVAVKENPMAPPKRQNHPLRNGVLAALLGGLLVTAANVSDILQWIIPDGSIDIMEKTRSTVESTDAKVDELVQMLRDQAARSGVALKPGSEDTIRKALQDIVNSVDARKRSAVDLLIAGDVDGAAASIASVAEDLDMASKQSVDAAAISWREAGAIYYTSNIDEAVNSYQSAYNLRPDDAANRLDLGYALIRAGRLDEAIDIFDVLAESEVSTEISADALRGVGTARKLRGEYDIATVYLSRAMGFAQQTGLRRQSLVLLQQGAIARNRGDYEQARTTFETASGFAEEIGDEHLLAESLNNLGIVMASIGRFDQAIDMLSRAYDTHVARRDIAGQATALGNLGATALVRKDFDSAEDYLLESVKIGERLGWQRSIALDLINLSNIAASRQQYQIASERLSRALDIASTAELDEIYPIILANMGELARERGSDSEACRLWAEALPALRSMQHSATDIVVRHQGDLGCPTL
ncbi:MAG: tetratricopeptide repeat protein [Gammaproteobacteria bacterium]|nr:tetratricopeptide repeat protein [Gammaproteobacteria bacterium]